MCLGILEWIFVFLGAMYVGLSCVYCLCCYVGAFLCWGWMRCVFREDVFCAVSRGLCSHFVFRGDGAGLAVVVGGFAFPVDSGCYVARL